MRKLTQHVLWDALLIFLPPLAVGLYVLFHLYLNGWLSPSLAALLGFVALAIGAVAILMRYRPNVPSAPTAARLIDDRAGAQDRFLTLATLQTSPGAALLLARLRAEAAGLQSRIAVQREFPYKIKRPVYSSLIVSFCVALLFHLLLPIAHSSLRPQLAHERLRDLVQQMAARPNLQELAQSLKDLAAKLENPKLLPQERQDLAREERQKVNEQAEKEPEKQDRDLLSQAAGTLQDIEQQSGAGERQNDQQSAGGDIQSNLPQRGQGESKQSQGSGGDSKGETNAESKADMQNGKVARGDPKEQGQEKAPGNTNGSKANQPDPDKSASKRNTDRPGTSEGAGADRDGRSKGTDEIPQTAPPADRFHKPGEGGYQGVKGAGYVTVQLPEEHAGTGTGGETRNSKSGKAASSQLPISNAPLPKHVPDAPSEKQQMPLEYRSIIR
ncbi:MAG TPA: hypothetical protein VHM64_18075 [Candidatus Binatia bacterium]|nr:hypothetical protein [Candidatus Binatia bacterium]